MWHWAGKWRSFARCSNLGKNCEVSKSTNPILVGPAHKSSSINTNPKIELGLKSNLLNQKVVNQDKDLNPMSCNEPISNHSFNNFC